MEAVQPFNRTVACLRRKTFDLCPQAADRQVLDATRSFGCGDTVSLAGESSTSSVVEVAQGFLLKRSHWFAESLFNASSASRSLDCGGAGWSRNPLDFLLDV